MKLPFLDKPTHLFISLIEKVVMSFDIKSESKDSFNKMDNDDSANKDKQIKELKEIIFEMYDNMNIIMDQYKDLTSSVTAYTLQNEINNIKHLIYENNNKVYTDINTKVDALSTNILSSVITTPAGIGTILVTPAPPAISLLTKPSDGTSLVSSTGLNDILTDNNITAISPIDNNSLLNTNALTTLIDNGILDDLHNNMDTINSDIHTKIKEYLKNPSPTDMEMSSSLKDISDEYKDTFGG